MSLQGIRLHLDQLGNIDLLLPREQNGQIVNLEPFHTLVENSRVIPGSAPLIARIEQHPTYKTRVQAAPVNEQTRALLKDAFTLRDYLKLAQSFVSSVTTSESVDSDIYVRFPRVDDLPALTDQLNTLQTILEQTILDPKIGGKMVVKSVDNGSIIMQLYLGSVAAVTFIGGLAWSSAVVYKKYQEALLVKMHVESLKIKNDALETIKDAQEQMLKNLVTAEARHLEKETFGGEENSERLERIKHSIELMQSLLQKGGEVHPALMAPEQVKNLFPDFHKLGSIESRIKQITETAAG